MMRSLLPLLLLCTFACDKKESTPATDGPTDTDIDTDTDDTDPPVSTLVFGPDLPVTLEIDGTVDFVATGLTEGQAYRITLVHADNLTVNADGTGVFVVANGIADAGPSEEVGLIYAVNLGNITPVKTFPAGTDDPNSPTGVFPISGQIDIGVRGTGGGTLYPVMYTNAGASTFLEVDATGSPTEPYVIGSAITVNGLPTPPPMNMAPLAPVTAAVGESAIYTIAGLNDTYAYRVTLVVDANITPDGAGAATFVDADLNGDADPGASETIAGLNDANGTAITPPAKTFPAGTDDPNAPTGIFPNAGEITITVEAIAAGTVYPVAYRNGGLSTFLEIDSTSLAPIEDYTVGGSFTVQ